MTRRPGPFRRLARAVRERIPWLRGADPPPDPRWPDDESLVPTGPPRRRPPSLAVAVEPPGADDPLVYPTETDAVATALLDEPPAERRMAARRLRGKTSSA